MPISKVLIANRGEIACRVARACAAQGVQAVAVFTEVDAGAPHTTLAAEAHSLGPAPDAYLDAGRLLDIAQRSGCQAVHPGYGFLSENAAFARRVEAAGLAWIGPAPSSIEDMGDKQRARTLASQAGVPVLPGSPRFDGDVPAELDSIAEAIGYPLLVKAAGGGGGIGMRRVERAADLRAAIRSTQDLALKAFGDATVYLESEVQSARHVEVQVFGFGDGRAIHLFERDCSVQRRFQKVVEESPAPQLPAALRQAMCEAAVALAQSQRYRGAGTVEFLYDVARERFYFLEMNTRIQVEHPVTEMVTGHDLVRMQIALALGEPFADLTQAQVQPQGHAIECRLYAERPAKSFMPSTGTLTRFALPEAAADYRVETGQREGGVVTHHYDPMLAKLIAWGPTREAATQRLRDSLDRLVVDGVMTNAEFLQRILAHPAFADAALHTRFVDQHRSELLAAAAAPNPQP